MKVQFFVYKCPNCRAQMNAAGVAAALPDAILAAETARRNGRRQTPHPGPGRPTIVRCPGCGEQMLTAELREHRVPCLRERLRQLKDRNLTIHLSPKDPDPYPDFAIRDIGEDKIQFEKLSSDQYLAIELQKIAGVTLDSGEHTAHIRLLGRVIWDESIERWRFMPSRIGRPSNVASRGLSGE